MQKLPIFLFVLPLLAQERLTLPDAVRLALESHPSLGLAAGRVAEAEGQKRQASFRPNPTLIVQTENLRPGGDNPAFRFSNDIDHFSYLQQTFETAGRRQKRVGVASFEIRLREVERELLRRQIAFRVKQAYWTAAGAQGLFALLSETERTFRQIVDYHEIRVKEGAMAEVDLLRVQLEAERIHLAAVQASLESARARILLQREMGRTEFPELALAEALQPAEDRPLAALEEDALRQRPEVELARVQLEQSRAGLDLRRAEARPTLDVLFGYKRTAGLNTMLGGVQVDLPAFNRNQGNIDTAAAAIRVAESNLAATQALIRAELAVARADYEIRRQQVASLVGRMKAQATTNSQIAVAAYREGGADLLRLLDAQRTRLDVEQLALRALIEYRQSAAALEAALGIAP